jgi:hypothetical protein
MLHGNILYVFSNNIFFSFPALFVLFVERSRFYRLRNIPGEVPLESEILIDPGLVLRV